ncbi:MAG: capsule biosynthesis protein CapD [Candidatus Brocadia sp.]|nr:GDP-L-fucose synthase [Candidatus Brocadia fulgida]MCC6325489.1 SDR family NAD(P)-dependent oxidoreductase [Candidatus Brocadia sp.]MCE7910203.1 SDR family NAD(P)-dependent oxidoreductase [Candidatus Brocadia sp. AMX3]MDG5996834.1 SDR family NAD(P)-dependent oxidoreductase [Candidatus Brocadia sp.]RIK03327.1 MAG: capsule biosynthesis protein CapD [Candidatus Brocadia sp.]
MKDFYNNKKILITGAAGTVGREIVRQLLFFKPGELRLVDNNESETFFLMEEYKNKNVFCFLGDVRDKEKIEKLSSDIDIIIHCAAFKHVILSEYNPFDVVRTNIIGVENVISAARKCNAKNVLFTSSDKAVNPTNVMGTSKLMGERLVTAANAVKSNTQTIFSSTRFGNVIGSRGSVVPVFMKQIRNGGPVTVTDMRMTRFVMTIEESARLVLKSVTISKGGEVFVTKMPIVRIPDLAEVMIEFLAPRYGYRPSDIKIEKIGAKPGEKLYEELMSEEEVHRSLELKDMFVITPAFKSIYEAIKYEYPDIISDRLQKSYVSTTEEPLSKNAIKKYLMDNKIFGQIEEGFHRNEKPESKEAGKNYLLASKIVEKSGADFFESAI